MWNRVSVQEESGKFHVKDVNQQGDRGEGTWNLSMVVKQEKIDPIEGR